MYEKLGHKLKTCGSFAKFKFYQKSHEKAKKAEDKINGNTQVYEKKDVHIYKEKMAL